MRRRALTLIELLIVMSLLSLMVQLLLPALSLARETARQLQCMTHLRRLGVALSEHHELHRRLPSGGWHYTWIGEAERGTGLEQPGGWAFNLLDYLDAGSVRRQGSDLEGKTREEALMQRCRTSLAVFHCPTRRDAEAYPQTWNTQPLTRDGKLSVPMEWTAKTDYAANVGAGEQTEFDWRCTGPETLEQGDDSRFAWPDTSKLTGVIFGRSQIRDRQIRDGLTHTLLLGEKYLNASAYRTGEDFGDNESLYNGFNNDSCRSTLARPQRDVRGVDSRNGFGSAHPLQWHALMCDGSVRRVDYESDPAIVRRMGNRHDVTGSVFAKEGAGNHATR